MRYADIRSGSCDTPTIVACIDTGRNAGYRTFLSCAMTVALRQQAARSYASPSSAFSGRTSVSYDARFSICAARPRQTGRPAWDTPAGPTAPGAPALPVLPAHQRSATLGCARSGRGNTPEDKVAGGMLLSRSAHAWTPRARCETFRCYGVGASVPLSVAAAMSSDSGAVTCREGGREGGGGGGVLTSQSCRSSVSARASCSLAILGACRIGEAIDCRRHGQQCADGESPALRPVGQRPRLHHPSASDDQGRRQLTNAS